MLKIIDFRDTTNHCVLTYEWNDPNDYVQTSSKVFDNKKKAYKYWGGCCRTYLVQQTDKINKIYSAINQEIPSWLNDVWMLSDKKLVEVDFNQLEVLSVNLEIVNYFKELKENCTTVLVEFKAIIKRQ